jgi:hypothetical protein
MIEAADSDLIELPQDSGAQSCKRCYYGIDLHNIFLILTTSAFYYPDSANLSFSKKNKGTF